MHDSVNVAVYDTRGDALVSSWVTRDGARGLTSKALEPTPWKRRSNADAASGDAHRPDVCLACGGAARPGQQDAYRGAGIIVGHHTLSERPTGCTVVPAEFVVTAGVDVRGAALGTRETDLLDPVNSVQ